MQKITLIRGQNGSVVWALRRTGVDELSWICLRDQFKVVTPSTPAGLEGFLTTVAQHSSTLIGAINQVIQLEV